MLSIFLEVKAVSKHSRSGGKFTGNHTTLIPAASLVCDIAKACKAVTKITPGFIKAGLKSVSGQKRLKIRRLERALHLSIRDNTSHQEVFVYGNDLQSISSILERETRKKGLHVQVGVEEDASTKEYN